MNGLVSTTDFDWFTQLSHLGSVDEVNFWHPSGYRPVKSIRPGEPLFFKLKGAHDAIGGFGFFARGTPLPASIAWATFREKNGVGSFEELLERIVGYRRQPLRPGEDPEIGCLLLAQPVFFEERDWVERPADWHPNIVVGKTYDLAEGEGARMWADCRLRAAGWSLVAEEPARYGAPQLVESRLGQGIFRIAVMDAYHRACAVTGEHSLPALEAAHIRPYALHGEHRVRNGLLLRADVHKLFDSGYVTVTPENVFQVSPRLKSDWSNGRSYYPLDGQPLKNLPETAADRPDPELLRWHNTNVFKRTGT